MSLRDRARRRLLPVYQHAVRRSPDLSYLFFEITQRCNLACLHCGSDCTASVEHPDLLVSDALRAAGELAAGADPSQITAVITGGEPLCHPGVWELGAGLVELGFRWGMVSNGWAWDAEARSRARASHLFSVSISLDGLEQAHDQLRGRAGSFRRALAAIDLLLQPPAVPVLDVVTCVHPGNLDQLPAIHDLLGQRGVGRWRLFTIDPIGRAAADDALQLDRDGFHRLMAQLIQLREQGSMQVNFGCGGYLGPRLERRVRDDDYFCLAGIKVAGVMVDGGIQACPNIDRRLGQGNIHRDNLLQTWQRGFEPYRRRGWMHTERCQGCAERALCQGNDLHLWDPEAQRSKLCHFQDYELGCFSD